MKKLRKAQSAISYAIKQLEDLYQIKLFERDAYRPSLTEQGKVFLKKAKLLLEHAREFENFIVNISDAEEEEIKIGISALISLDEIAEILKELKSAHTSTNFHINIDVLSGERLLLNKEIDIAIMENVTDIKSMTAEELFKIDMPIVTSIDHPLSSLKKVTETDLAKHPQIILKSTIPSSEDFSICEDANKWFVSDMGAKKKLIEKGLGWGRLPLHYIKEELSSHLLVKIKENKKTLKVSVYVAKLKKAGLGPIGKSLWKKITEAYK